MRTSYVKNEFMLKSYLDSFDNKKPYPITAFGLFLLTENYYISNCNF